MSNFEGGRGRRGTGRKTTENTKESRRAVRQGLGCVGWVRRAPKQPPEEPNPTLETSGGAETVSGGRCRNFGVFRGSRHSLPYPRPPCFFLRALKRACERVVNSVAGWWAFGISFHPLWDAPGGYTLKRKWQTSPGRMVYSLPSTRSLPASLMACSVLCWMRSSML